MKKSILFAIVACILMACEGPEGPMGPMGPMGPSGPEGQSGGSGSWYATSYTINADEWQLKGNPGDLNTYFYVYKPLKELTEDIYRRGTVIAYIETDKGVKNGMPYVLHLGEASSTDNKEFLWTQTYDFDFVTGEVGFYVTYSDFKTEIRPGKETFHIVLMW